MKKKLLFASLFLSAAFSMNAQTVVWSDNFDDEDLSDWTLLDEDGDTRNWGDQFVVTGTGGIAVTPVSLISRSWVSGPTSAGTVLTPDNWAISQAIVLPQSSTINLTWVVQAAAAAWSREKYGVYVGVEDTPTSLMASNFQFIEIYPGGTTGAALPKSLNLSDLAGQTVHIAFRHFDCTDQDFLSIDDVTVTASALSTNDFFSKNFTVYPNPSSSVVNLSTKTNSTINNIQITDLNGRTVKSFNQGAVSETQINISDLSNGMYIMNVQTENGIGTTKISKN